MNESVAYTLSNNYCYLTEFLRMKSAACILQQYYRARREKIRFNKMRRAAVTIQAYVRGMFARVSQRYINVHCTVLHIAISSSVLTNLTLVT